MALRTAVKTAVHERVASLPQSCAAGSSHFDGLVPSCALPVVRVRARLKVLAAPASPPAPPSASASQWSRGGRRLQPVKDAPQAGLSRRAEAERVPVCAILLAVDAVMRIEPKDVRGGAKPWNTAAPVGRDTLHVSAQPSRCEPLPQPFTHIAQPFTHRRMTASTTRA